MMIEGKRLGFNQIREYLRCSVFLMLVAMLVTVPVFSHAGEAELKAEIDKIWAKMANIEPADSAVAAEGEGNWADRVTISGVVEVEAGVYDDDMVTESDIALATVELGIDAEVSEFSSAHVLFLYEDGEDVVVDEASITVGNTEKNPLYMTAGRMYVPFGNYESQMVSDPMTVDIGETQEDALQVGVEAEGFYASVYAFNGDADDGGDDEIEHYGVNVGYAFESDTVSVDVGGGWISSIQDSDGLTDALIDDVTGLLDVTDYIEGYAAHLIAAFGPVTLIGEYVGADDNLNGVGTKTQIAAYNVEVGVSFPLAGKEAGFAIGYQESEEAVGILAEERIVAALAVEIMDGTTLAVEWLEEEDYSVVSGGSGTDWNVYTLQLAAEF